MTRILRMESDLKKAWDLVQVQQNILLHEAAMRDYKKKLAAYLRHKLFIASTAI